MSCPSAGTGHTNQEKTPEQEVLYRRNQNLPFSGFRQVGMSCPSAGTGHTKGFQNRRNLFRCKMQVTLDFDVKRK